MIGGIELRVMVRRQRTTSGGVWPGSLEGSLAKYETNQRRSKISIGDYCFSNRRLGWSIKIGTKTEGGGFRYDMCMDELADVVSKNGYVG